MRHAHLLVGVSDKNSVASFCGQVATGMCCITSYLPIAGLSALCGVSLHHKGGAMLERRIGRTGTGTGTVTGLVHNRPVLSSTSAEAARNSILPKAKLHPQAGVKMGKFAGLNVSPSTSHPDVLPPCLY